MSLERLYKYGRINEYSETLFSAAQVWFSSPSELNDPFECQPWITFNGDGNQIVSSLTRALQQSNPLMTPYSATAEAVAIYLQGRHRDPQTWENVRKEVLNFENQISLYCLSQVPDSILMWSHYSDGHNGYCLEFEATDYTELFGEAQQVQYSEDYPTFDNFNTPRNEQIDLVFFTKYKGWCYEQEWRIIDHQHGRGLRSYPAELLRSVIFGLKTSDANKTRIREWLHRRGHAVRFCQAVRDERKFSIKIQEIT